MLRYFGIFTALLLYIPQGSCEDTDPDHVKCAISVCNLADTSLRFFLIGDWGGIPVWPFYTKTQNKVAQKMAKLDAEENIHFHLSLGDNFYKRGVKSVEDERFAKTFEEIYVGKEYIHKPWYILAGNHDHHGNVAAQIEYTNRSRRWVYPHNYYTIKYKLKSNLEVHIIMLDTIILCGDSIDAHFDPPSTQQLPHRSVDTEKAEKQWKWLEEELKQSMDKAHYLFVAGHYPLYSTGEHGPTPCLVNRLRPLLHKYKVSAYFAGHDHRVEHLAETHDGWTVHYVLSGAGAMMKASKRHENSTAGKFTKDVYPKTKDFKPSSKKDDKEIEMIDFAEQDTPKAKKLKKQVSLPRKLMDVAVTKTKKSFATLGATGSGAFVYAVVDEHEAVFNYIPGGSKKKRFDYRFAPRIPFNHHHLSRDRSSKHHHH